MLLLSLSLAAGDKMLVQFGGVVVDMARVDEGFDMVIGDEYCC